MKGSEFCLKISFVNRKKIAIGFKIHIISYTLVLAVWKNPEGLARLNYVRKGQNLRSYTNREF